MVKHANGKRFAIGINIKKAYMMVATTTLPSGVPRAPPKVLKVDVTGDRSFFITVGHTDYFSEAEALKQMGNKFFGGLSPSEPFYMGVALHAGDSMGHGLGDIYMERIDAMNATADSCLHGDLKWLNDGWTDPQGIRSFKALIQSDS